MTTSLAHRSTAVVHNKRRLAPPAGASSNRDLLGWYLTQLRSIPVLSAEEQGALHERYRQGDETAGERLVLSNLRSVVRIAMHYHAELATALDLVQEGNLGLLKALDRFDAAHGVPFSAYARYWIRASILSFVMKNHRMLKVGNTRSGRRLFFELARERARLSRDGNPPSIAELSESLGIEREEMDRVLPLLRPEAALDDPDEAGPIQSVLTAKTDLPDVIVERSDLRQQVRAAVEVFAASITCPREAALLHQRLMTDDPQSLAELARGFSVSRERMRQIEAGLKRRLRAYLSDVLDDELAAAA